jgi:tetrahydromethanopterin S-methyltransferase subunit A
MSFKDFIFESTNYKAAVPFLEQAKKHIENAAKALESADKHISTDDAKYYKSRVEEMISAEKGASGLESLIRIFKKKAFIV